MLIQNVVAVSTNFPMSDLVRGTLPSSILQFEGLIIFWAEVLSRLSTPANIMHTHTRSRTIDVSQVDGSRMLEISSPCSDLVVRPGFFFKRHIYLSKGFPAFSALRAYSLSNRNKWLTAIIFLLALPPATMYIVLISNVSPLESTKLFVP